MNWKQQQKEMLRALQQQEEARRKKVQPKPKVEKSNNVICTVPVNWTTGIASVFDANLFKEPKPRLTSTEPSARLTELVGWRQWRLEDGKLWSMTADCCWEGPTLSARKPALAGKERLIAALRQPVFHPTPDPAIGIMAYKKASLLDFCADSLFVLGSVYLWGSVAEHTHGYRAERATVRSLLVHPKAVDQIEALQARYQPESIGIYRSLTDQREAL